MFSVQIILVDLIAIIVYTYHVLQEYDDHHIELKTIYI